MVIYEVNLTVNDEIVDDFLKWLEHHIAELLKIEGFLSARVLKVEEEVEGAKKYCCQYTLSSREKLQNYFDNHAAAMRQDGLNRFGNKFSASRRILEEVSSSSA